MSKQSAELIARKYLNIVEELYPEITAEFEKFEDKESYVKGEVQAMRFSDKIKKALKSIKQIDISQLSEYVNKETFENIEQKIDSMYEDLLYMQKRLFADEYIDNLRVPVAKYIRYMGEDPVYYSKWAKNQDELVNKFVGMLTHPDNIETYKNQIKRMALGTMSQKEFNKIYHATKHKMIALPDTGFKSFKNYKQETGNTSKPIKFKPL